ncbi:MAG: serine/threonine-protein kinase, partial [Polyangiaceae bacterium]
ILTIRLAILEGEARKLDRFDLVAELATGGMATVYLGRISGVGGFQRFVAIKRLHPHLAREPEFTQMFLDEARLAARIHHPNVVSILEIGASPQGYYLVMDYVEGGTLGHLIGRCGAGDGRATESTERTRRGDQTVPVHVGARIVIDMLNGLHAAHELADDDGNHLGIVHRDVSPQNVLVGVDGSARLSDFGVARATSRLSTTQAGQLKGKLAYMAPEQARGVKDIDRRADVFAAGVVLWETLAGRRLFKGDGEADTFNKVLNDPIPQISVAMPSIPPALGAVLDRALQRDRDARFPTAGAFAEELENAVRKVANLGTHKDVAAYLYAVLGSDIAQQRDAVRLSASRDPSRSRSPSTPPPPL